MGAFRCEERVGHESEDSETVVDGDEHHAFLRPDLAVELGFIAPATGIGAAVDPECHGQFFLRFSCGLGPDVQVEAVLAERGILPVELAGPGVGGVVRGLHGAVAVSVGDLDALPRHDGLRLLPAKVAHGRRRKRDAFVNQYSLDGALYSMDLSSFDVKDRVGRFASGHGQRQGGSGQKRYRSHSITAIDLTCFILLSTNIRIFLHVMRFSGITFRLFPGFLKT